MYRIIFISLSLLVNSLIASAAKFGVQHQIDGKPNRRLSTTIKRIKGDEDHVDLLYKYGDEEVYLIREKVGEISDDLEEDVQYEIYDIVTQNITSPYLYNLDRVDSACGKLNNQYTYKSFDVTMDPNDDIEPVLVYVIDTGVREHVDFSDRLIGGVNVITNQCEDNYNDNNGHGTFVASQIVGDYVGAAKSNAEIYGIKALDDNGSGATSDIIKGIYHAVQHTKDNNIKRSIINMSIGGGKSVAINDAVQFAVDKGLLVFAAAGNSNKNACGYSPAGAPNAWTVGASTIDDHRAAFSNHGKCVDFYVPGSNVLGATINGKFGTKSGTSMSTPTAVGLVVNKWLENPSTTSSEMIPLILSMKILSTTSQLDILTNHIVDESEESSINISEDDNTYAFDKCFQFTSTINDVTSGYHPGIRFMLYDQSKNECSISKDTIATLIGYSRVRVHIMDDDDNTSGDDYIFSEMEENQEVRMGQYIRANKRFKGTPFTVKVTYDDFKYRIKIDDEEVFMTVYDKPISNIKLGTREGTTATFSTITNC